jgi:hypothetical protein
VQRQERQRGGLHSGCPDSRSTPIHSTSPCIAAHGRAFLLCALLSLNRFAPRRGAMHAPFGLHLGIDTSMHRKHKTSERLRRPQDASALLRGLKKPPTYSAAGSPMV